MTIYDITRVIEVLIHYIKNVHIFLKDVCGVQNSISRWGIVANHPPKSPKLLGRT